jgi:hypothetical protein
MIYEKPLECFHCKDKQTTYTFIFSKQDDKNYFLDWIIDNNNKEDKPIAYRLQFDSEHTAHLAKEMLKTVQTIQHIF